MHLVSVVIPAFNAERFIEKTLLSAVKQTHQNLEIIVIDDGSTDHTCDVVESFASRDERIRVISVSNGGVAKARNIGIEASRGEFVAFLDADDLWHPKKIELQLASLTDGNGSTAAATYAFHRVIDVDDRVIGLDGGIACDGYVFARLLYGKFIGNGSSLLVRREVAVALGGYESSWAAQGIGGCEDLDFELKVAAKHSIIATPAYLLGYRIYVGNMSSDRVRMARAIVATVDHHIGLNPQLPCWAARMAKGAAREYSLHLSLAGRRPELIASALAALFRSDPRRACALAALIAKRKVRKILNIERDFDQSPGAYFNELSPAPRPELPRVVGARRDRRNMQKLAKVDSALRLGL